MLNVGDKLLLTAEEYELFLALGSRFGYPFPSESLQKEASDLQVKQDSPNLSSLLSEDRGVLDIQVGGNHYKRFGNMQPWEVYGRWFTKEELRGFMKGTVMSYLARDKENQREDIEKAMHTIQLYLEISKKEGKE